jgi:hypothetical protein
VEITGEHIAAAAGLQRSTYAAYQKLLNRDIFDTRNEGFFDRLVHSGGTFAPLTTKVKIQLDRGTPDFYTIKPDTPWGTFQKVVLANIEAQEAERLRELRRRMKHEAREAEEKRRAADAAESSSRKRTKRATVPPSSDDIDAV